MDCAYTPDCDWWNEGGGRRKETGFHTCEMSDRNVVVRSFRLSDATGKHRFGLYSAQPHGRLISLVPVRIRPSAGQRGSEKVGYNASRGKGKVVKCLRINVFVFAFL